MQDWSVESDGELAGAIQLQFVTRHRVVAIALISRRGVLALVI
jgi:hypothetical protein